MLPTVEISLGLTLVPRSVVSKVGADDIAVAVVGVCSVEPDWVVSDSVVTTVVTGVEKLVEGVVMVIVVPTMPLNNPRGGV